MPLPRIVKKPNTNPKAAIARKIAKLALASSDNASTGRIEGPSGTGPVPTLVLAASRVKRGGEGHEVDPSPATRATPPLRANESHPYTGADGSGAGVAGRHPADRRRRARGVHSRGIRQPPY